MPDLSDALWDINNEYRKRITQAKGYLTLLEAVIGAHGADPGVRAALRHLRATLDAVDADHSTWRHTYFYRAHNPLPDYPRMVSRPSDVQRALRTFSQMLGQHLRRFDSIVQAMDALPRPDPALTRVIKGNDLWQLCRDEIEQLATYDHYAQGRLPRRVR
ncbi:MAG: hypothetical protein JW910_19175 [Anaerolineae bacterium]|nr:hypothetical protein [Anaerolineae bacterium]